MMKRFILFFTLLFASGLLRAQIPVITNISPASGLPGSSVTITGTDFNGTPSNNIVYFGGARATVTGGSSTSLTVTAPIGGTYGIVSVWDSLTGLAGFQENGFLPVFDRSRYVAGIVNFRDTVGFASGGNHTVAVALGDFDGDGKLDAVTTNYNSNTVSIFQNTATAGVITSSSLAFQSTLTTQNQPSFVKVFDIDGDGKLDIVASNQGSGTVSIFHNTSTGTGSFSFASAVNITTGAGADDIAFGDFDVDGKPDMVVPNFNVPSISLLRNVSSPGSITSGSFEAAVNFSTRTQSIKVFVGDLDGDDKADIAVANLGDNSFSVFRNLITSAGSFSASSFTRAEFATSGGVFGIGGSDLDGDGNIDIVVNEINLNKVSIFRNTSTTGSVSFAGRVDLASGTAPYLVDFADMDGDGKEDIFIPNTGSDRSVTVFRNTAASGSITATDFTRTDFSIGAPSQGVALGDIDGDGKPDIIATKTTSPGGLVALRNNPLYRITAPVSAVCVGSNITLTDTTIGGTWSSADTTIGAVGANTGIVTGVSAGPVLISYTVPGGFDTFRVTVNPTPTATVTSISGRQTSCLADTANFVATTIGGTWSVSNTARGTISATGGYYPRATGVNTISYTLTALGCTGHATFIDTTITVPSPVSVFGTRNLCLGSPVALNVLVSGGTWVSRSPSIATVNATTGAVTGLVAGGTATMVYTITNLCGSSADSATENVLALPTFNADTMQSVCRGITTTLLPYTASTGALAYSLRWLPAARSAGFADVIPGAFIFTFAGNGISGYTGDGGTATSAKMDEPFFMAIDASGNKYFADSASHVVRKISTSGTITTVAGNGSRGSTGDGSAATAATLDEPMGVWVDASNNIYITDFNANRIRKITAGTGIIRTICGNGTADHSGEGTPATAAEISQPAGIVGDNANNLYIAEWGKGTIRRISSTGIITTIAGSPSSGTPDFVYGIPGPAVSATFGMPMGIGMDRLGNIYFTDQDYVNNQHCVLSINTSGIINVIAGDTTGGAFGAAYLGDGGAAVSANLNLPSDVKVDDSGNVYIADMGNNAVRRINATGIITTFAGPGETHILGDGGPAQRGYLDRPTGIAVDQSGFVYVTDAGNNRVRGVTPENLRPSPLTVAVPAAAVADTYFAVMQISDNACYSTTDTISLIIKDITAITAVTDQTICHGDTSSTVVFASSIVGSTYSWVNTGDLTLGLVASGSGNIASFTATNTSTVLATTSVVVTPSALGCVGLADTFLINVKPQPTVSTTPSSQSICNGQSTVTFDFTGTVAFTNFQWTQSNLTVGNPNPTGLDDISGFTVHNTDTINIRDTFIVTPVASGCFGPSQTVVLSVKPTPSVRPITAVSICNGLSSTPIGFSGPVSGTNFTWSNTDTSIGLFAGGVGNILPFLATNSGTTPLTSTITVQPNAAGCVGTPSNFTISVLPTPTVDSIGNQAVCNNATTLPVTFGGAVSGTTFTWSNDNPTTGLGATATGNIAAFTATNMDTANNISNILVTPSASGCFGSARSFSLTVYPTPVMTRPSAIVACNGDTVAAISFLSTLAGTTFGWTNSDTSIGLSASGTSGIASFVATNTSFSSKTVTVIVTPTSADGCNGDTTSFTITVNPTPSVNTIADVQVCNGSPTPVVPITGTVPSSFYSWTNSDTSIGLIAGGSGSVPSFTAIDTSATAAVAVITITPSAFGCTGADAHFSYTVIPSPSVNAVSDVVICNNDTTAIIGFSGRFAGTTYVWNNDNTSIGLATTDSGDIARFVAVNSGTDNDTANINVTPHAGACFGPSTTFRIIVKPTPVLNSGFTASVCDSATFIYVPSSTVTGATYSWTRDTVSGISNLFGAGIDSVNEVLHNTTALPVVTNYQFTLIADGCSALSGLAVTVKPTPVISTLIPASICDSSSLLVVLGSATPGTTITWSRDSIAGIANASASGNDTINERLDNTTVLPITVIYVDTLRANGCANIQQVSLSVNPIPVLNTLTPPSVCDSVYVSYVLGSSTPGTSISWSRDTVIGIANSPAIGVDSVSEILVNTTALPINVIYFDTLFAGGCQNIQRHVVAVNPTPVLDVLVPAAICDGTPLNYVLSSATPGTMFSWFRDTTAGIANISATGIDTVNEVLNNTSALPINVTYFDTLVANGCTNVQSVVVTVNPTPRLTTPLSLSVCDSAAIVYVPTTLTPGTTIKIGRDSVTGISAAGSYGLDSVNESLDNTGLVPVNVIYMDTLTANGCTNIQAVTVTVNPTPMLILPESGPFACDSSLFTFISTSLAPGVTYTWSRDVVAGISNASATGIGDTINEVLVNTTTGPVVVTYVDTLHIGACMSVQPIRVTVNPLPVLSSVVSSSSICDSTAFVYLGTSLTAGTVITWSRDSVAGIANAAAFGTDSSINEILNNNTNVPVVVRYVDTLRANGCVNTEVVSVTVNPVPVLSSSLTSRVCTNDTFNYAFGSPAGGVTYTWSRDTVSGISNAAANGAGNPHEALVNTTSSPVDVIYIDTLNLSGCINVQSMTVTVNPRATLTSPLTARVCSDVPLVYTQTSSQAGTTYKWYRPLVSGITNADRIGTGDIIESLHNRTTDSVTVVYSDTMIVYGCKSTANVTVTVYATPTMTSVTDSNVCDSTLFAYVPSGPTSGTTFAWTRPAATGIANTAGTGAGNISEYLNNTTDTNVYAQYFYAISAHGCTNSDTLTVKVKPTPRLSSVLADTICQGAPFFYVPSSYVSGTSYTWTRPSVSGITPATGSGADTIRETLMQTTSGRINAIYVYSLTAAGCANSQNVTLTVNPQAPAPNITIGPGHALCSNTLFQNFGADAPPAGVVYTWSAVNAFINNYSSTGNNVLVSFPNAGAAKVIVTSVIPTYGCSNSTTYDVSVSNAISATPTHIFWVDGNFYCADNTMDSYQWGNDDKTTLDSTLFPGEVNQYYRNASPDFNNKYYWVITTKGGCSNKTYYNVPVGVVNVNEAVSSINVYPNPAEAFVTLEVNGVNGAAVEARLMDMTGKELGVYSVENNKARINVDQLASGVYIIGCYRDGIKIGAVRFIKN